MTPAAFAQLNSLAPRAFKGPLVHVSCCMARLLSKLFKQLRQNEGTRRDREVEVPLFKFA